MNKEIYVLWQGCDDTDYAGTYSEEVVGAFNSEDELIKYVQNSVRDGFTPGSDVYARIPASYEFVAGSEISVAHGFGNAKIYYYKFEKVR